MEMEFIVYKLVFRYENDCLYYMTRVTQEARQRHFIFYGWGSSGRRDRLTILINIPYRDNNPIGKNQSIDVSS